MKNENFFPTIQSAIDYDNFINWNKRLEREIPFLLRFLENGTILDIACGSGRHAIVLSEKGFKVVGIDYSENIIKIANDISKNVNNVEFFVVDATSSKLKDFFLSKGNKSFDNTIILGNSIANMGSLEKAKKVIENIYSILKEGGKFITQTINRPIEPYFLPLRKLKRGIMQRIMFPISNFQEEYNVELHFKLIDTYNLSYLETKIDRLYMFSAKEFEKLVESVGFKVIKKFSGFNYEPFSSEETKTVVWIFEKN
ncbi:MAG: class I SAM-dependent methyltransferase [Candidatus Heimdallarchaeum endolithica]|uniref:Class I SAM-dependent methyltransferase n=1 Tax=Candidatus Heimdallarchaeum endolithica TaxID=2876572 RepID=A0A9Y1FQJ9_9ARCH|nr:MAG: class I SAM-dependent methyltransferase [Candidatus Heimdallarchaeum endolithica]